MLLESHVYRSALLVGMFCKRVALTSGLDWDFLQAERENNMLQSQINMLMTMINDAPEVEDEEM